MRTKTETRTSTRTVATGGDRYSRRAFLRRLGVGAAALPLLHAERARAATASGAPKRIITLAWTNGVAQTAFYPPAEDPVASEILKPLAAANLGPKVLMPLGLDLKIMLDNGRRYDGHFSYPAIFTGTYKNTGGQTCTATGPSIDQFISDALAKQVNLPVPLLNVVIATGRSTSFRGEALRNTGESDPARLFTKLFAGATLPPDQLMAIRARRKSVLDFLGQELNAFGGRLGTEDRTKISAHLESIRKLELELSATAGRTCMAQNPGPAADYPARVKVFSDLVAMAIRCDQTRVVSMVWGDDGGSSPGSFPFLGVSGDYHGLSHQGATAYPQKIKIDTWYFQQIANLAKQLDDTPEVGGTALDNTVIVTANDMNEGAAHGVGSIPFVLIGSCGGALRTGRAVRLGNWVGKTGTYWRGDGGVPHNKLLATLCNAMDVPAAGFGAAAYAGTLPELTK